MISDIHLSFYGDLLRRAERLVGSSDAGDIVQRAYEKAIRHNSMLPIEPSSAKAVMFTYLRYSLAHHFDKLRNVNKVLDSSFSYDEYEDISYFSFGVRELRPVEKAVILRDFINSTAVRHLPYELGGAGRGRKTGVQGNSNWAIGRYRKLSGGDF